jgi:predicted amidohydrolase YtcJ
VIYLLVNATVYAMDDSLPVSQALAVKDGRIVEIGGTDEILWLREDDYELIDLQGRTIVPGATDSAQGFAIQGTLGAGQNADFLVLSGDPLEAPEGGSPDIHVVEAWVGGRRIMVRP